MSNQEKKEEIIMSIILLFSGVYTIFAILSLIFLIQGVEPPNENE